MNAVRVVAPLPAACLLLALATTGCVNTSSLQSDVMNRRAERLSAWQAERAGQSASAEAKPELETLTGNLSLDDSIFLALGNSRQILTADLGRQIAAARVTEARSQAYPQADLNASYVRLGEAPVTGANMSNYALTGSITQPLYRGGAISAGIRAASLFHLFTDEQYRSAYQLVLFNVRKAYYDASLAMELETATTEAVDVAKLHLQDVQKNFEAGTASSFEVLSAEVEMKNLEAQQVQDHNRYNLAVTTLYNILGVSQESTVALTYRLSYDSAFSPTMEQAVALAYSSHPDILQQEYNVRLQQEAVQVEKSGYWPVVNAVLSDMYARPNPAKLTRSGWGNSWNAGVFLNYPIFQGFRTVARVKEAMLTLRQSEVQLTDTEQRILLQIRQALLSLEDAARFVQSQQANVEQAQEALRLAELGFREGVRKEVEVADARRSLTSARANLAQANYNHEVAKLLYEQATGTLQPPSVEKADNDVTRTDQPHGNELPVPNGQ